MSLTEVVVIFLLSAIESLLDFLLRAEDLLDFLLSEMENLLDFLLVGGFLVLMVAVAVLVSVTEILLTAFFPLGSVTEALVDRCFPVPLCSVVEQTLDVLLPMGSMTDILLGSCLFSEVDWSVLIGLASSTSLRDLGSPSNSGEGVARSLVLLCSVESSRGLRYLFSLRGSSTDGSLAQTCSSPEASLT